MKRRKEPQTTELIRILNTSQNISTSVEVCGMCIVKQFRVKCCTQARLLLGGRDDWEESPAHNLYLHVWMVCGIVVDGIGAAP
jgi:hypothetical protein